MSSKRDWSAEVAAWRTSGKTAQEFCAERGYSTTRLYWWSSELKRRGAPGESKTPVMALAKVVRKRSEDSSLSSAGVVIVHVGAARIEVTARADRAALTLALEVLAATSWDAKS